MKLSSATIDYLIGIITGDNKKTKYKSGPQLVQFFNSFGEGDEYGQGFPSRTSYVQEKLNKYNNTELLAEIINQSFHPANLLTSEIPKANLVKEANDIFSYEGFKLSDTERGIKIQSLSVLTRTVDTDNSPFEKDMFKIFISHRDGNKTAANELKQGLNIFGISCFVAHEDIEPSTEWQNEIEKALFSMDALLALLSPGFSDSVWTNQEVGVAFGRGCFILSVKSGEDPKGFVGKFQALRPKGTEISSLAVQIAEHLIKHERTSEKMLNAYIQALSRASQFAETEKWALLIDSIISLSFDQAKKMVEFYNSSSQRYDCFRLNGGKYGRDKNIADYLNEWTKSEKYTLSKNK